MLYLAYFDTGVLWPLEPAAETVPLPIRIAGPALFIVGLVLVLSAIICSVSSLKVVCFALICFVFVRFFIKNLFCDRFPPTLSFLRRFFRTFKKS